MAAMPTSPSTPSSHCEPPPVPYNKRLLVPIWMRGCKVTGDACYAHLQANAQPVIVTRKSIYSSPDAEKSGCAGGRRTEFLSLTLLLKAFSCVTHAYCAPAAGFATQKKRQSSRCLKKPLGDECRQGNLLSQVAKSYVNKGSVQAH